jgi:hypothetical protein
VRGGARYVLRGHGLWACAWLHDKRLLSASRHDVQFGDCVAVLHDIV